MELEGCWLGCGAPAGDRAVGLAAAAPPWTGCERVAAPCPAATAPSPPQNTGYVCQVRGEAPRLKQRCEPYEQTCLAVGTHGTPLLPATNCCLDGMAEASTDNGLLTPWLTTTATQYTISCSLGARTHPLSGPVKSAGASKPAQVQSSTV